MIGITSVPGIHNDVEGVLVALYRYRCSAHGAFDLTAPIGTAPDTAPCPGCTTASARQFTAPMLATGSRSALALIDRTRATADTPAVVGAPPPRPASRRTPIAPPNPALRRLPRP
ncbi:zinc ribbon domain-containing protein [Pseudonocardia sp. N23]|uniref:zinc ribbon domain-containing protein n=1 Tax=Pseudonocardia sp. N23 TaxID=1987376 RepID=UPI000C038A15|nr:zinc ribbon domain-containing protein [Pseudonocardia sp. N23]GAY10423.1 hypothetical protein TOK_4784 [Pseudonocardia sp. N23]